MVLREEQERLQLLLREAIPMMCKNGVPYQTEFCVEALIGITIDKSDVVLVSIKETFNKDGAVCQTPEKSPKKRRRKRRKSNSSKQSDVSSGDSDNDQSHPQGGSDGDSYPEPARKTMKPDPNYDDYEDNEDELVTIKAEPVNIQGDHSEYEQGDQTFDTFTTTQSPTQNPQDGCNPVVEVKDESPSNDTPVKRYVCNECGYTTLNSGNFYRHKSAVHEKKTYQCTVCEKVFKSNYESKRHIRVVHENEKLFSCELCNEKFYSRNTMVKHKVQAHKVKSKFQCEICLKELYEKNAYEGHMNKHKNLKPFSCYHCDKVFRFKGSLHRHLSVCDGERESAPVESKPAHICPVCGCLFRAGDALKEHISGHHGKRDKVCVCGKAYSWRTCFARHKRTCEQYKMSILNPNETGLKAIEIGQHPDENEQHGSEIGQNPNEYEPNPN